jgi:hypothetical protein
MKKEVKYVETKRTAVVLKGKIQMFKKDIFTLWRWLPVSLPAVLSRKISMKPCK